MENEYIGKSSLQKYESCIDAFCFYDAIKMISKTPITFDSIDSHMYVHIKTENGGQLVDMIKLWKMITTIKYSR